MTQRYFIPGSEWLYYKVYLNECNADAFLITDLYPVLRQLEVEGRISQYFFIRYTDPDFHIRLRLRLNQREQILFCLQRLEGMCEELFRKKLVWKVQCDTYVRELERYGSRTIEQAEQIFYADSAGVLEAIRECDASGLPDIRRSFFAMLSLDRLCSDFHYSLEEKHELFKLLSETGLEKYGLNTGKCRWLLDRKYRENRQCIEEIFLCPPFVWREILHNRQQRMQRAVRYLVKSDEDVMEVPVKQLLRSFMHMSMNRLFRNQNVLCEVVVYYFLSKYYASRLARQ